MSTDPYAPLSPVELSPSATAEHLQKVPLIPVPPDAPELDFTHPKFGRPIATWPYRSATGDLLGYDARFEYLKDTGAAKEVLPLTFCQVGERRSWRAKSLPVPRPLYGLDRLATRREAPVLIVEGCKSAEAAQQLLPEFVVTTWPGGGEAVDRADWSPLVHRDVLIWPDRDRHREPTSGAEKPYDKQVGTITGQHIVALLQGITARLWVLDLSDVDRKDGWDAADALAEGWTSEETRNFIAVHRRPAADIQVDGLRSLIKVDPGELHITATEGETALIRFGAPLYDRGGIVRPIIDDVPAAHGGKTKVARLTHVDSIGLVDYLSRAAEWRKYNVRKQDYVAINPPQNVATSILARDGEWRLPKLAGVITTPTLRPDGTILSAPGYDPATRLLLLQPPPMPELSDRPTRDEAIRALALLDALLGGFPFVDDASRSVALSALITPVVRGAMLVAPLHAITAPVAGSGKSYIVDIASAILTGDRAPVIAAGRNEEETEKRLASALLYGLPIVSIDNVNGQLGGDFLCQMIERPVVSVRPLGVSKVVRIESRATMFATGNNIQLVGDMTRRVVVCSLDPNMERPELRTFNTKPFETVVAERGKYVAAALTIVRAYIAAGSPDPLSPLASFEDWSNMVRSAIAWLGWPDPMETMAAARAEDPVLASLSALLYAWYSAVQSSPNEAGKMKELAETRGLGGNLIDGDLYRALFEVSEGRSGMIDAKKLGVFLARHNGRIVDDLKLHGTYDSHRKQKVWQVERVSC